MSRFSGAAGKARASLIQLADRLFGCRHRKTTMPMTPRPDEVGRGGDGKTYIVCLECGRRLAYDMKRQRGKRGGGEAQPDAGASRR